jgi:hypothetical protein
MLRGIRRRAEQTRRAAILSMAYGPSHADPGGLTCSRPATLGPRAHNKGPKPVESPTSHQ